MSWTNIKTAIKNVVDTMRVSNGYNYDHNYYNRADIFQDDTVYCTFKSGHEGDDLETNLDDDMQTGIDKYRNRRLVTFQVFIKNTESFAILDDAIEDCKDKLELALQDYKIAFSSVYNSLGDNGVCRCMYKRASWDKDEKDEQSDLITPVVLNIEFFMDYEESRGI